MPMASEERRASKTRRGGALLSVLWLSAALGAIAFSVANTVRQENERTSTSLDQTKAYFLARGAIERAMLYMLWGPLSQEPSGRSRYHTPGLPYLDFEFPGGQARVEIIPEWSKLNINTSRPEVLMRLLLALGTPPRRAEIIAAAIFEWRTPLTDARGGRFDPFYLTRVPSFSAPHASIEEIEELLLVHGMTPELFHGAYERNAEGALEYRGGLRDCVSVYGATDTFDINTIHPALMAAIGLPPQEIAAVTEYRRQTPFLTQEQLMPFVQLGSPALRRLAIGGGTAFTLRATARARAADGRLSDARRSVAVLVKRLMRPVDGRPFHVLRWYDDAPVPEVVQ